MTTKIINWNVDKDKSTVRATVSGGTNNEAATRIAERLPMLMSTVGECSGIIEMPNGRPYTILFDRVPEIKKADAELKKLSEYTDAEKITWFDETYTRAMCDLDYIEEHGCDPKDCNHYMWEWCMDILGENLWARWNAAYRDDWR